MGSSGVSHTWVQIPALTFLICVTLGKELPCSVPKFPHLENRITVVPTTQGEVRTEQHDQCESNKDGGRGWKSMAHQVTCSLPLVLHGLQAKNGV